MEHVNRDCSFFAFLASSRDVEGFCCFIDSTLDSKVFSVVLKRADLWFAQKTENVMVCCGPKMLSLWEGPKWSPLTETVPFLHFWGLQEMYKNG